MRIARSTSHEVIRPALARGAVVLTDRFSASTLAYQGFGRQLDRTTVMELDAIVRNGLEPALTIVLDCPVTAGLQRARGNDRFHREEQEFHERVRSAFLSFANDNPNRYRVIDATQSADVVHHHVVVTIDRCLSR